MLRHPPLLESNQAGVAVSHVQGFIVVQQGHWLNQVDSKARDTTFFCPNVRLGNFCWLMRLVGNVLWHRHGVTDRSCGHSASTSVGDSVAKLAACLGHKVLAESVMYYYRLQLATELCYSKYAYALYTKTEDIEHCRIYMSAESWC